MNVQDVMTAQVVSASSSDSLQAVASKMKSENIGSLPVVDGGRLRGVVTDRDIVIRAVAQGQSADATIESAITTDAVCVAPDCSVEEASRIMADKQLRRLYVTDADQLVGVVALGDLALETSSDTSGDTLRDISKP
jgi:signal-transduction protein with cAMP-binding, CBS, and nucleotidyltransferase domain